MTFNPFFSPAPALFDVFVNNFYDDPIFQKKESKSLLYDITENADFITISMVLPGYLKEFISIKLVENHLKISGKVAKEKSVNGENLLNTKLIINDFEQSFKIKVEVDANAVTANLQNGILIVSLPKQKREIASKEIIIS